MICKSAVWLQQCIDSKDSATTDATDNIHSILQWTGSSPWNSSACGGKGICQNCDSNIGGNRMWRGRAVTQIPVQEGWEDQCSVLPDKGSLHKFGSGCGWEFPDQGISTSLQKAFTSALQAAQSSTSKSNKNNGHGKQPFLGKRWEPQLSAGIDGTMDLEKSWRYCIDMGHELKNCLRLQAREAFLAHWQQQNSGLNWRLLLPGSWTEGKLRLAHYHPPFLQLSLRKSLEHWQIIQCPMRPSNMSLIGSLAMSVHNHRNSGPENSISAGLWVYGDGLTRGIFY